jgi:1-acyl-sn-glycerol-3-phosphate acyltransferase
MVYRLVRAIVCSICKVLFRVRVTGKEHVPRRGAYIVAPSHRSILDVPFTAFITRRQIRFMSKKELLSTWIGRTLFGAMGAIPVDRSGTDRSALRAATEALEHGQPVAVFPEGTRNAGPVLGELHDGAAYLALKLGVPIVPVGIGGSEEILASGKLLPRIKKVAVVVGPLIVPETREAGPQRRSDVKTLTEAVRAGLQQCFDDARAAVGASASSEVGQRS